MQTKIKEFFDTNPEATEVHSALGVLFTDKAKAEKYLGGVLGQNVETHYRETEQAQTTESGGTGGEATTTNEVKTGETAPGGEPAAAGESAPGGEPAAENKEALTPEELEAGHNALAQGKPLTKKRAADK